MEVDSTVGEELVLGEDQRRAYDRALNGENIFISGPGGVGKSVVLRVIIDALREKDKSVAVTAYTGIAALHVGGSTIHSYLGTRIYGNWEALDNAVVRGTIDLEGKQAYLLEQLDGCEVLVVDEISMMTGDYMDMMDRWLRFIRGSDESFGGVQVIFSGDFLQLSPVIRQEDEVTVEHAFHTAVWRKAGIKTEMLTENFRQEDQELITHLMSVRTGVIGPQTLAYFNQFVGASRNWADDPTWLMTHNNKVLARNLQCLGKLVSWQESYEATYRGRDYSIGLLRKNCIAEDMLQLKEDALVMVIKNDRDGHFVNGTRARVKSMKTKQKGGEDRVVVLVAGDDEDELLELSLGRHSWEYTDYKGDILAQMQQIPLKLAWAITIHKSQGMTLDQISCNLADCFATGQAYTALSRIKSAEGLSLERPLTGHEVATDPAAVEFYQELEQGGRGGG